MRSESVEFENASGTKLSGVLEIPSGPVTAWAIFAHCFTCSKKSLAASRVARGLAANGIGVLRFDFTGLGESDGEFAETGFSSNVSDLVQAAGWMASEGRSVRLLIGHSLGGAASLVAAGQIERVQAVTTIGAPSDAGHVAEQFSTHIPEIEAEGAAEVNLGGRPFTISRAFLEDVKSAEVKSAVSALRKPVLFLHAPGDEIVGIDNATELFVTAKHPKSFVSLDQADHLLTRKEDAVLVSDVISGWARRYLGQGEALEPREPGLSASVIVSETLADGPYQNDVRVGPHHFLADEPADVGGADTGADPYSLVAAGLGACTSITLRMYATRKGWPLTRVTVGVDHEKRHDEDCIDCGPNDRIDVFTRSIQFEGDLDDEKIQRLLEIADRCPVHRTLEHGAKVTTVLATKPA